MINLDKLFWELGLRLSAMVTKAPTDSQVIIYPLFQAVHKSALVGHFLIAEEFSCLVSGRKMATNSQYVSYGP